MLIVDASVLFEVLSDNPTAEGCRRYLDNDPDQAAPHLVDAEVLSAVQTHHRRGNLDLTAATQAVEDLRSWPGQRYPHQLLLDRAWELRDNVRGYDALYVSLAEVFDATLLTLDRRLATASGVHCRVEVPV